MFEDIEPRSGQGEALKLLTREDLDLMSVEGLEERIASLEGEIQRSREAIEAKRAKKSAADALFTFRS